MVLEINLAHQVFPYVASGRDVLSSAYRREKLMLVYANRIAARHLTILTYVAEMAERDELISDLSHSVVRSCSIYMHMVGAEPEDIRRIFGGAIKEKFEQIPPEQEKYRNVLESAYEHLELLLFCDRN